MITMLKAFVLVVSLAVKGGDGKIEGFSATPMTYSTMTECLKAKAEKDKMAVKLAKEDLFAYSVTCVDNTMKVVGEMDATLEDK